MAWLQELELYALLCLSNFWKPASVSMVCFICKHRATRSLAQGYSSSERGSVWKLSREAAAAGGSHSGSQARAASARTAHRASQGASTQLPHILLPREAEQDCSGQASRCMVMMSGHVIILYHKLPTSLYSREDPLLQCFFFLFSFIFLFLKEKKLCNVCLCLHHAEATLSSK